jgi:FixJ family two-component response regulator
VKKRIKYAFILDKDEFVRLSLNKILNKYGFQVEEIEDFPQLEDRKREIDQGIVLADVEIDALEKWLPLFKKWSHHFIFMSPLVTEELTRRLKKMGIRRMIKKPVEPRLLKRAIREICSPEEEVLSSPVRKRERDCQSIQKGGEST